MPRILDMTRSPDPRDAAPLGGTRAEALQRLQIGIGGLVLMVMSVALASLVRDRADEAEAEAAAPSQSAVAAREPEPAAPVQNDPLAEAGVVPDMPPDAAAPTAPPSVPPSDALPR